LFVDYFVREKLKYLNHTGLKFVFYFNFYAKKVSVLFLMSILNRIQKKNILAFAMACSIGALGPYIQNAISALENAVAVKLRFC
jgi:hypothetical protein